jgi:hypothetical protein
VKATVQEMLRDGQTIKEGAGNAPAIAFYSLPIS